MERSFRVKLSIIVYFLAVVAADLSVTHFGQAALIFTSWVLIPLDLIIRDLLHDAWKDEKNFVLKMSCLILLASITSFLVNHNSKNIAIASFLAFSLAGIAATFIYQIFINKSRLFKMNTSNAVSSIIDSFVFPIVAFGTFNYQLIAMQALSKFLGGFVWSLIFVKKGLKI